MVVDGFSMNGCGGPDSWCTTALMAIEKRNRKAMMKASAPFVAWCERELK
jgi:hypothetical protein